MIVEKIMDDISNWVYGITLGLLTAVAWLLRKVLTNERQLDLLNKEIAMREEWRKQNDEEIKSELKELKNDIKSLLSRD